MWLLEARLKNIRRELISSTILFQKLSGTKGQCVLDILHLLPSNSDKFMGAYAA